MANTKPVDQFIHSTFLNRLGPRGQDDAVVTKVHRHHPDGRVTPELKVIKNPKRRFYTTHKGLRDTYTEKKEWEDLHNLEVHTCHNADLPREIFRALQGFYPQTPPNLRKLYESPYLYGADISIEALIKAAHREKFSQAGLIPAPLTRGMFDVETSMLQHNFGQLIMATVSHEEHCYTAILRSNLFTVDAKGNKTPGTLEELQALAVQYLDPKVVFPSKKAQKAIGERRFQFHFHLAETPLEILQWTLGKMHENRTDFMGVWNLPFDMGRILDTCRAAHVDPAELLCPRELEPMYRQVRFAPDPGKKDDHFSRRWHWLYAPAYTQWYDAMCLYSILRIVDGFEASYALDHVLKVNDVCDGKLKFKDKIPDASEMSTADWHRFMQTTHPYEYVIYNIFDVMSVQVMEWINNDVAGMHVLAGDSALQNFNKQTRRSADALYFKCLSRNKVTATTAPADTTDSDIIKHGGAVLTPERTWEAGLAAIREAPGRETYAHAHVNDIDLSQLYPSIDMACNISRETKLATLLRIEGFPDQEMRTYTSMLVNIPENAVPLGTRYYGLPGYTEMTALFQQQRAAKKS